MTLFLRSLVVLVFIAPTALPATSQRGVPGVSIGNLLSQRFEQTVQLNSDRSLLALVDRVAQTLVRNSPTEIPIVTRVIESDEVNVVSLPGGHVYVTTALIRTTDTEAELAWALAYGIAPVVKFGLFSEGRTLLPDRNEAFVGNAGRLSRGGGLPPEWTHSVLVSGRKTVEEADTLSLQYLFKADYDPHAAVSLLQKIEATSSAKVRNKDSSGVFDVHPKITERIRKFEAGIRKLPKRDDHLITTRDFDDVHARLVETARN